VSAVADKYPVLTKLGVEVFSVSVDSHFVHKMWNDNELTKMVEGGVPFHMVSDQAGNVGRAYGAYDETQGIELRGRFIIDPDGVIQAMEVLTPSVGRRFAEVDPPGHFLAGTVGDSRKTRPSAREFTQTASILS
jgi:alkyl hydroperoxide reductase subunit AhpC